MRTPLLSFTLALLLTPPAIAQISAGEEPSGTTILNFGIDLVSSTPFNTESASLELDCDDMPEITVVLFQGQPEIDAPNIARLELMDPGLELCMDLAQYSRPQYYSLGQVLDCSGNFEWQSDSVNILGDLGGFTAIGPMQINDMYVAYRLNGVVGWIRLSFDLVSDPGVELQIPEALTICPGPLWVAEVDHGATVSLLPNATDGEAVRVTSRDPVSSIELLDRSGRSLAVYPGSLGVIPAPVIAGLYLVRVIDVHGHRSTVPLTRY